MKLYASYSAENLSIHIKTITSNVWSHSKPFKIASNISFKQKLVQKLRIEKINVSKNSFTTDPTGVNRPRRIRI